MLGCALQLQSIHYSQHSITSFQTQTFLHFLIHDDEERFRCLEISQNCYCGLKAFQDAGCDLAKRKIIELKEDVSEVSAVKKVETVLEVSKLLLPFGHFVLATQITAKQEHTTYMQHLVLREKTITVTPPSD